MLKCIRKLKKLFLSKTKIFYLAHCVCNKTDFIKSEIYTTVKYTKHILHVYTFHGVDVLVCHNNIVTIW